jgi:hypothetical protein
MLKGVFMGSEKIKKEMESINVTLGAIHGVLENGSCLKDEGKMIAMLRRINYELELQLEGIRGSSMKVVEPSNNE